MYKKIVIIALLIYSFSSGTSAQINSDSPYSRYGYGDISESTPSELKAMGGASIGNRTKITINPVNPASYSSVDSMTFMFDIGTYMKFSRFSDTNSSSKAINANLDYITMRFPVTKWLGVSAGLLPYSFGGYTFNNIDTLRPKTDPSEDPRKIAYSEVYSGKGGFSQIYGGLSVKAFDMFAVGVNAYYTFGEIANNRSIYFTDVSFQNTVFSNKINASNFRLRYGLQYFNTFKDKHNVTLGLIYENKTKLGGSYRSTIDNVRKDSITGFEFPEVMGAGINYNFDDHVIVGVDYKMQNWGKSLFFNKTDSLVNTMQLAAGVEYVHNPRGKNFKDRIRYRLGFNTSNPYYKVSNANLPNNFTVSFGVGMPVRTDRFSYVNATLEYTKIGAKTIMREDYLKLTLSASINEYWFFKRKL